MKKYLSRFLWLIVCGFCAAAVHAQHTVEHIKAKNKSTYQPPAITELLQSLKTTFSDKKIADLSYELANAYLGKFKVDSAIWYTKQVGNISQKNKYILGTGKYHLSYAGAFFLRNRSEEALLHLDTAIKIFQSQHSDLYLGLSYRLKGRQLGQMNQNTEAQLFYRRAIAHISKSGDLNYLHRILHDFGRNFYFSYEVDSAALYLTQALKMAEQMGSYPKMFNTAAMLGTVYLLANDIEDALRTLDYAISICPPEADKIQLRSLWANYTEANILAGRYELAEKALKEHDKINALLGDVTGELNNKKLNGIIQYYRGNIKGAKQNLAAAYELRHKMGSIDHDLTSIALYLGLCELKEGMTNEAIRHFQHARQISARYNFIVTTMEANQLLAQAFEQSKQMDSAYHYYRVYTDIKDSIFKVEKDKTIFELSAKYNMEKKEFEIKELTKEKKIVSYQLELETQQSEANRLRASEQSLALVSRNKEFQLKQRELEQVQKENKLQQALALKESQNKKMLYGIIIAGLLAGGYGFYRYRLTEKMRKQLALSLSHLKQAQQQLIQAEKKNEAEKIRLHISRDIHDEVGATLSGVVLFSEIARQKIDKQNNRDAEEYLEHIYSNSKDMLEKMSDIVWAINPKNDSFEKIVFKLKSYAMNLCAGKGIELHFTIDKDLYQLSISMQNRRNIYLLLKEALNNAVKYSGAKNIYFLLKLDNEDISIEVRDDGKGFEFSNLSDGNGISNMQNRALELGSELQIDSAVGKGTRISLQFQFHPNEVQTATIA